MSTSAAPQYNFDHTWNELIKWLKLDGPGRVISLITDETDLKKRNAWFRFCYQGLCFRQWEGRNIDAMLTVGEAAIANALGCSETVEVGERSWWIDQANAHCYNISANLADCWEDGIARQSKHFEKGLELALRAETFREQLGKPASSKAMAAWAKGKHLLSLQRYSEARAAFQQNLAFEERVATEQGSSKTLVKEAHFGLILGIGFLALCDIADNIAAGEALFAQVIATFEAKKMLSDDDKEESELGMSQLQASRRK